MVERKIFGSGPPYPIIIGYYYKYWLLGILI
jgi:hypothetical protein